MGRAIVSWEPGNVRMALGESHSVPEPVPTAFGRAQQWGVRSRFERIMERMASHEGIPPRIIIFSESGPLGGDLTACLSGRYTVERVTSLSGVGLALGRPAGALLVVPDRRSRLDAQSNALLRKAVDNGCRVLLLGCDRPQLDDDLKGRVVVLPQFPSPAQLFEVLSGLGPAEKKAEG